MTRHPWPRTHGYTTRAIAGVLLASSVALAMHVTPLGASQEQRPVFRGAVDRVRVDVIVRDHNGRFVDDLRPDDFLLFEDGLPQEILSVELVEAASDATPSGSSEMRWAPSERNGELIRGARAAEEREQAGDASGTRTSPVTGDPADPGAIVYLIDSRRLEPKGTTRFIRAWRERLGALEHLPAPQAAYLIDHEGWFREIAPLTSAASVLKDAIEELERQPKYSLPLDSSLTPGTIAFDQVVGESAVLALIEQFCSSLGALRGRKALIWVSGGFPSGATPFDNDSRMTARLEALARTANSANLSIYTIDPTRRIDLKNNFYRKSFDVSRRSELGGGGSIANEIFAASLEEFSDESLRNGLVYAAKTTGGLSFLSWSDMDRTLEDIEGDTSSYYLLTYQPPPRTGNGRYRAIRVEVADPSLQVRYRAGYVDYREGERREQRLEGALAAPGITPGFPLRIESIGSAEIDGRSVALIGIVGDLPVRSGAPAVEPGEIAFAMSGTAAPKDRSRAIRAHRWLRWQDVDRLPDSAAGTIQFRFEQGWPLGPGEYEVRVALYQPSTEEIAVTRLRICVETAGDSLEGASYFVTRCVD